MVSSTGSDVAVALKNSPTWIMGLVVQSVNREV